TSLMGVTPSTEVPGAVDVMVSTSYGADYGQDAFTYIEDLDAGDVLEILSVTPPSGPSSGGNVVTIVAKGLTDISDTDVTFGGQTAVIKGVDPEGHLLLVEAPVGDVGTVEVVVTNGNGEASRDDGYTYESFIKVYDVAPNFGPVDGGTAITIEGVGFQAGAQVRVGALPASSVQVLDEGTITAVVPPGSPGLANVTVLQGALKDTLVGGFAYQTEMDLWVIEPAQGSQAGGTFIDVIGSGFPGDATVLVGGTPATHVKVESPTKITARTPPGSLGTVDVTVLSQSKGSVALPWSFTYYDPESAYGGTWGNEVDGEVNVTVVSGADGSPMADVFVMLWTDPSTPYQGYTNQMGQITFSGPELMGEQMVSASKEGFASQSVVEYNATNITLYMTPTTPASGAPPPGQPPPIFNGQVVNAS
ncbi:MAG: IPT/TIG domain-containing protein, partial [Myxococcota bacterium]|nr:IPT/TIG domain-containing protein [Myxococcota bacterium]